MSFVVEFEAQITLFSTFNIEFIHSAEIWFFFTPNRLAQTYLYRRDKYKSIRQMMKSTY